MKSAIRQQRGIGLMGLLFFLIVIIFCVTVAVKLGPHYMGYLTVRSVMQDVTEDPSLRKADAASIKRAISDRLYVNEVRNISPKSFKFKKVSGGYRVSVDYQVQEHLMSNVDALLNFNHEVTVVTTK